MRFILFFLMIIILFSEQCFAKDAAFGNWLEEVKKKAVVEGVSKKTISKTIDKIDFPIKKIIELDRKQPEKTISFNQYKKRVITNTKIRQGRRLYKKHKKLLNKVSRKYNVPPQYIVALWGIETNYGNYTGGFDVVKALATLAYDGRRRDFFLSELIDALKILDEGHISFNKMKGSWAGAMGQNQFMPSSFHRYAVDGDNDGKRDIWTSLLDVFSSTANYLSKSGWRGNERWGRRVKLPKGFDKDKTGLKITYDLKTWKKMGITLPGGVDIPIKEGMKASIVAPDGIAGPAFLVYDNYRVIMKWNKSIYFASCVGLLADQIVQ